MEKNEQQIELFFQINSHLTNNDNIDNEGRIGLIKNQYDLLALMFEEADGDLQEELKAVKMGAQYILPRLEELLNVEMSVPLKAKAVELYEDTYAFVSRRSFHHFVHYMEWDRPAKDKAYATRINALKPVTYYLNKMTYEEDFMYFAASFPPNYGKSFIANYYSGWVYGLNINSSILRISYSDTLVKTVARQIKSLIESERYLHVFPQFAKYNGRLFEVEREDNWKLKGADTGVSHMARPRGGQVTGFRANHAIIFDDVTKGEEEADNDKVHEEVWNKYASEWVNRKDGDNVKEIFLGTMWNAKDMLGKAHTMIKMEGRVSKSKFNYVEEVHRDGKLVGVIIKMPLLDENEESTLPGVYTTRAARRLKGITPEFLWSCVYQQDPIPSAGRVFAWENIRTWKSVKGKIIFNETELPVELNDYAYASLDPVRKGEDNIAMPIFRVARVADKNGDLKNLHFMIDAIYRGKSMEEIYDEMVNKIIAHRINKMVLENNTDTSLKSHILGLLKERGYEDIQIMERFNTKQKFMRIKDENYSIRNNMVFPEEGEFPMSSDVGRFMTALTTYSFETSNRNDDAPDSCALYSYDIIKGMRSPAKVVAIDRGRLGF